MKKLLVYLDPSYQNNIGHYNRLSSNIHSFVEEEKDIDILHFINKNVNTINNPNIINHFEYSAFINYEKSSIEDTTKILSSFREDLKDIFLKIKEIQNNYSVISIYMYTASIEHLNIILEINKTYIINNLVIHGVLFYLNRGFTRGEIKKDYIDKILLLSKSIKNNSSNNFSLYFDSDIALNLYQKYFHQTLLINAIPLYKNNKKIEIKNNIKSPMTISYFGYQSFFHGFHIFYLLYKKLKSNLNYNFIVRANKLIYDEALETRIKDIKNNPNVQFEEDYIEDDKYKEILQKSDIIIIPYLKSCYPVQTSGIFIESVFEDKYVIVASETWMDTHLKKMNNGISFDSTDIESIIDSFDILLNKIEFTQKEYKEIEKFKTSYTVEKLFKQIGLKK